MRQTDIRSKPFIHQPLFQKKLINATNNQQQDGFHLQPGQVHSVRNQFADLCKYSISFVLRVKHQLSLAVSFTSLHKENTVIAAADITRCKCHDDHQTLSASLYIVSYLSCSVWLFSAAVSGSWWTVPRSLISSTRSRMCVVRIDLNY